MSNMYIYEYFYKIMRNKVVQLNEELPQHMIY